MAKKLTFDDVRNNGLIYEYVRGSVCYGLNIPKQDEKGHDVSDIDTGVPQAFGDIIAHQGSGIIQLHDHIGEHVEIHLRQIEHDGDRTADRIIGTLNDAGTRERAIGCKRRIAICVLLTENQPVQTQADLFDRNPGPCTLP